MTYANPVILWKRNEPSSDEGYFPYIQSGEWFEAASPCRTSDGTGGGHQYAGLARLQGSECRGNYEYHKVTGMFQNWTLWHDLILMNI